MDLREAHGSRCTAAPGERSVHDSRSTGSGDDRGMTLVEMVVTLIVFGLLLAASTPGFRNMLEAYRFSGALNSVTSRLSAVRQLAVRDKVAYRCTLDLANHRLAAFADDDNDGVFEPGERVLGPWDLGDEIRLQNIDWTNNRITFLPNGTASQTGDIRVTDIYGRSRTIRVNSTTGSTEALP